MNKEHQERLEYAEALIAMSKRHGVMKFETFEMKFELSLHDSGPAVPQKVSMLDLMPSDQEMLFYASEGMTDPVEPKK